MNPRLRLVLVAILFPVLAAWTGISLAQEKHFLAVFLAGISLWGILAWTRGPLAEAWMLAFLFFGYVIGNRGFAQISLVGQAPILMGEMGLAIGLPLVLLRGMRSRVLPLHRDWLHFLLLFWIALGTGRIAFDLRAHGFVAVRDFAMIYYVAYFFVARALIEHDASRRLLHQAVLFTFAVLPGIGALGMSFPDFFQDHFSINGVPIIYYKGDLLATFLFTGYVILVPPPSSSAGFRDGWRWLAAAASLVLGLLLLSRSSLVGLLVAMAWMAWARRWRPFCTFVAVCAVGLMAVTVHSLLQKQDFSQTKAYAIYEVALSIVDYSGTRAYVSSDSSNKGDNNRFRLVWWRNVLTETATTSPLLGLGFGADLARGFVLEYYPTDDAEFTARSPHNIFVTTFGRMGALGVAVLAAFYWAQARATRRTVRAARRGEMSDDALTYQAAVWVVLISACLGVVLEGPMGAIPFWIMLGLAHQATTAAKPEAAAGAETETTA